MIINSSRLTQYMDAEGLDGLIATSLENVYYFTEVYSLALRLFPHDGQCYAVITRDKPIEPFFISSRTEIDQVLDSSTSIRGTATFGTFYREVPEGIPLTNVEKQLKAIAVESPEYSTPVDSLTAVLKQAGLNGKKVGVDELGILDRYHIELTKQLPQIKFMPVAGLLRKVRRVKTTEEISRLRASAKITENAILAAVSLMREGVTEQEMEAELKRTMIQQDGIPGLTLVRFGRNGVSGQVRPNQTALRQGDTVWFDVGCIHKGYWSDIARVFSLGIPSNRSRMIYQALLEGEQTAIEEIKPGMTGRDAFQITVKATHSAGLKTYRRHHVGHGIGLEMYEQPLLGPDNQDVIEEGSVLNIETPYYEFGLGALHVEDPVLISSSGNSILTTLSRELQII